MTKRPNAKISSFIVAALCFCSSGCNSAEQSMQRGNMAYRNGNPSAAVAYYKEALTSPETRAAASFNLGKLALEQGQAHRGEASA